jgi:hypothetical protein
MKSAGRISANRIFYEGRDFRQALPKSMQEAGQEAHEPFHSTALRLNSVYREQRSATKRRDRRAAGRYVPKMPGFVDFKIRVVPAFKIF